MVEMRLLSRQEGRGKKMKARATIGLTIDIDLEREMGLEISEDQVEEYTIERMVEFIHECIGKNQLGDFIAVEVMEGKNV